MKLTSIFINKSGKIRKKNQTKVTMKVEIVSITIDEKIHLNDDLF